MNKPIQIFILFALTFFASAKSYAQDTLQEHRLQQIRHNLDVLRADNPGLDEMVELSISNMPLDEFLRGLAQNHELNIDLGSNLKQPITNNFTKITVAEILYFLASDEGLDYSFTGNIIAVTKFEAPVQERVYSPKVLNIEVDSLTQLLSVDFKNDSLHLVAKQLTKATGKNIIYSPKLKDKRVTLYLLEQPLQNILFQLAFANEMTVDVENDSLFHLRIFDKAEASKPRKKNAKNKNSTLDYSIGQDSTITLIANNHTLGEIVEVLFGELQLDYYYYSELDSKISLKVYDEPLDILLQKLFYGTKYTFRKKESIYYFGDRNLEGLRETRRIHLISRSVEKIITYIPTNLIKDVQLLEFPELNSLMVSGSYPQILELEAYIKSVDKPVPVVQIEVIIIDYNRNHNVATGFEMGLGEQPVQTTGSMGAGGVDLTVGAQSINSMINSFNGFGALNLGPVTRNFYVTLKAMETNGIIKTRSTPKLATLNGTEANITIAQTEYYAQENQSFQGVQNPIPVITRTYNPVTANFELNIKPYLAGEDQVTLTIEVSQSDFTARIAPDAPPGQVTRTFNTIIRVKDQEMILLGGLEETTKEETGSGVPVLSRIPVLKWFFSSRNKRKSDNRLNIFIKPTIIK